MISQAQTFIKGHLSQPFMLQLHHKSTNLLHSGVLTSGMQSEIIRVPLSNIIRRGKNGVGSQGAQILTCSTSAAAAIDSNKKWHPSKQTLEQLQNRTNLTFSSARRINNCRVLSPNNCDSVRSYSSKTSEKAIIRETTSFNNHSDEAADVINSNLQDPHRKLPEELEIVKNNSKLSDSINDDIEAETDFVYGGRRDVKNVEPLSSAMSHLLTYDDGKEAPLPSEIIAENIKALSHLISSAETCFDVFHIYEKHQNQLNFLHYDLIVKRLTDVIDRATLAEVYSDAVFVQLCERLCKNCCQYDPPMLLSLLQMLNTIKVSPDALIMLTTLQMLRKKIDSLDVKELLLLDKLLSSREQGALGNALRKAVPLSLECLYSSLELPSTLSPSHLSHGLLVCANSDSTEALALADKFMMTLYEHDQGVEGLAVAEAVTLITGLLEMFQRWMSSPERQELMDEEDPLSMHSNELYVEQLAATRELLLEEALQLVALNLLQLSHSEVEELQSLVSHAYRKGDRSAHSQPLLDAFVRCTLEQDGSLQALATGVAWMLKMDAVEESLVQALLDKLLLAPSEELCRPELAVLPLIHALAASDALQGRPKEQCHALLGQLLQHPSAQFQSQGNGTASHTRLAIDLACLGYFEPLLYRPVLECAAVDARQCLDGASKGSGVRQFVALCQAQQLLAPQHSSIQVDEKLLFESKRFLLNGGHLSSRCSAERDLVRQLLQHSLSSQGPDSVVTRVHTRHGVLIDHVLVARVSGEVVPQPEAVEGRGRQGSLCLDDLAVPDGSRVIGVVQVGPSLLLNSYSTLRPLMRLDLQLLAAEGVTVVPLIMPRLMLHCCTDQDKLDYVIQALGPHDLCL